MAIFPLALAAAAVVAQAPASPKLTPVFTVRVEIAAPVEQGEIDGGRRRFIPITGGTITGPRLSGTVLPGGGDWQTIYPGGFTRVEARYFLKADDGTVIGIFNPGVRVASQDVTDRIARGERVDPSAYYFRSSPVFDPPPGKHQWLRDKTFVARGIRMPDHVLIEIFAVE
ncbi:DUF3237 domain-containing protein [uncultured Sphingomonas sp.]|uniref:DUF3237 domain-containing protein n=1 Tax=uncultured Sphingomonas sp. TaxID=158754 RepID=UPI0026013434|nr:DUF3237 domain-containing protein [uncultured Sphingomonas sp.]